MNAFHLRSLPYVSPGPGLFNHVALVATHRREMDEVAKASRLLEHRLTMVHHALAEQESLNLDLRAQNEALRRELRRVYEELEAASNISPASEEQNPSTSGWVVLDE
jgi:phosphomevalonate kinase